MFSKKNIVKYSFEKNTFHFSHSNILGPNNHNMTIFPSPYKIAWIIHVILFQDILVDKDYQWLSRFTIDANLLLKD